MCPIMYQATGTQCRLYAMQASRSAGSTQCRLQAVQAPRSTGGCGILLHIHGATGQSRGRSPSSCARAATGAGDGWTKPARRWYSSATRHNDAYARVEGEARAGIPEGDATKGEALRRERGRAKPRGFPDDGP